MHKTDWGDNQNRNRSDLNKMEMIVSRTAKLLKQKYRHDSSGHDWGHMERVWKLVQKLAKGEKVDLFVVEMAALLHDVDDYKFKKANAKDLSETKKNLEQFNIPVEIKSQILEIVKNVSFKGAKVKDSRLSLEGQIVQDADRLEAMGAIGIARVFSYSGYAGHPYYDHDIKPVSHKSFAAYKKNRSPAINHFYEKLLLLKNRLNTPQAKKLAQKRHKFLQIFLKEFFREIEESQS